MIPIRPYDSRYRATARRALLVRQAAIAALVLVPGVACGGTDDAAVFGSATTDVAASTDVPATTAPATEPIATAAPQTGAPETTAPVTEPDATVAPTTDAPGAAEPATGTFPAGGELAVSFTFAPSSSDGRIQNPYIAVWVEDADGNLVKTISLWYEQSRKGSKWLSDLRQWALVSGSTVDETTSSATQVAGDYSVVWDGTDLDGNAVSQGDYVLYVEAAREHGPYEITSTPLTVGNEGFVVALDDDGELTALTAELMV